MNEREWSTQDISEIAEDNAGESELENLQEEAFLQGFQYAIDVLMETLVKRKKAD